MEERLHALPKPVVALARGPVLDDGIALLLAADLALAGHSATLQVSSADRLWESPAVLRALGGSLGRRKVFDLLATGRALAAHEAAAFGLVSRVVADDALDAELETLVRALLAGDPATLALTKRALQGGR